MALCVGTSPRSEGTSVNETVKCCWSNHPLPFPQHSARKVIMVHALSHPSRTSSEKKQEILNLKSMKRTIKKNHSHKLHPFTNKRRMWYAAPSVVARERLERLPSCPSMPTEMGCPLRVPKCFFALREHPNPKRIHSPTTVFGLKNYRTCCCVAFVSKKRAWLDTKNGGCKTGFHLGQHRKRLCQIFRGAHSI